MSYTRSAKDPRANRLLAELAPQDFAVLEPHLEIVKLQRRQVLYETGEILTHAYFPHDTVISLVAIMEDGSSAEMSICGHEGVIGLVMSIVSRRAFGRYIVQIDGTASRISIEKMHEIGEKYPTIRKVMWHFLEAIMSRILQSVACNALHSVEARCCRLILSTDDRTDQDVLPLTHEFLAERLGVQRSTVSAVMGKLQANGLIQRGRGGIIVADRPRLEDAACECYQVIRNTFERLLPNTFSRD